VTTLEIGRKLVELCSSGRTMEALDTLYSKDAVSVEAIASPNFPQVMEGVAAIKGKNEWWYQNNEIHRGEMKGPYPHGDRFAVFMDFDVTAKAGAMAGQRMQMQEVGLYTVKDGAIVREEFFYAME
jgi:ketosteroid isomerase-like protein